jgi:predicted AlkP superfamily phosphohydrolase/phosphomutase
MTYSRVLIIGLDGATFDLIDPLIAEAKLPTLARLARLGARGKLRSTVPSHSGPAWSSFATGTGPGKHGIYSFFQRSLTSYTYSPVNSRLVRGETLWQHLGRAGKTVGVMNVPGTFPPTAVNGYMITGMLSPGLDGAFYPPILREEILKQAPDYSVEAITVSDKAEYLKKMYLAIEARKKAALYLMDQHPVDLSVVVFTELDRLQHFFWSDMDPHHPAHDPRAPTELGQAIDMGYIALDQAVNELIEAASTDTLILIISDHGFEGVCKVFYVNKWLAERGYLVLKQRRSGAAAKGARDLLQKIGLWDLARRARNLVPGAAQFRSDNLPYAVDIDWSRTKAAFGPNLGININLQGREPKGIILPGREFEELCQNLTEELEAYIDPESGERIVNKVMRREDVYSGNAVNLAPDLRLMMAKSSAYRGQYAYSPKVSASQSLAYPDKVFGNHAEYGIFMAHGPGVRPGTHLDGAQIIDVAPTVLFAMGLPIPYEMDGRPLIEMFDSTFVQALEKRSHSAVMDSHAIEDVAFDDTEEEQVMDRLRRLGYLE